MEILQHANVSLLDQNPSSGGHTAVIERVDGGGRGLGLALDLDLEAVLRLTGRPGASTMASPNISRPCHLSLGHSVPANTERFHIFSDFSQLLV